MVHAWTTLVDWTTEVDGAIWLPDASTAQAIVDALMRPHGAVFAKHAQRTGVPLALLYGVSASESFPIGNVQSESPAPNFAQGLMQVMPFHFEARKIPRAQWRDPDVNIGLGADILADAIRRYGRDVPKVAAAYNSGGNYPNAAREFGYTENAGYTRNVVTRVNFSARFLAQQGAPAPATEPVAVMPLGDSLTLGYSLPFASLLDAMGARAVGRSRFRGAPSEGHGGYDVERIAAEIGPAIAAVGRPGLIVWMGGTNDLYHAPPPTPETTANRVGTVLDTLKQSAPAVIVCTIPLVRGKWAPQAPQIATFNARLRALVALRQQMGERVWLADVERDVPLEQIDATDGVHFTSVGYALTAECIARVARPIVAALRKAGGDEAQASTLLWPLILIGLLSLF